MITCKNQLLQSIMTLYKKEKLNCSQIHPLYIHLELIKTVLNLLPYSFILRSRCYAKSIPTYDLLKSMKLYVFTSYKLLTTSIQLNNVNIHFIIIKTRPQSIIVYQRLGSTDMPCGQSVPMSDTLMKTTHVGHTSRKVEYRS